MCEVGSDGTLTVRDGGWALDKDLEVEMDDDTTFQEFCGLVLRKGVLAWDGAEEPKVTLSGDGGGDDGEFPLFVVAPLAQLFECAVHERED